MDRIFLAPGYTISRLIKGGWQLAGGHGAVAQNAAIDDMFAFAKVGITTLDCADIYTGVEELIGAFLRAGRERHGSAWRDAIQIHTKFVPDLEALPVLTKAHVAATIERSLQRLGSEQLDLVQFHWWDYDIPRCVQTAIWLDELRREGKIRHVGLTNFDTTRVKEIVAAGVPVVAHQLQYSLLDRRPQNGMVEFCRGHNISLLCYGALAGGFLSDKWLGAPEPQEPLANRSLTKYKLIIDEFGGWGLFQVLLKALSSVAARHHTSVGMIAARFAYDLPQVAGVIVGARDRSHLAATVHITEISLDDSDRQAINTVLQRARGPVGDVYTLERMQGGRHASIMKYNLNQTLSLV